MYFAEMFFMQHIKKISKEYPVIIVLLLCYCLSILATNTTHASEGLTDEKQKKSPVQYYSKFFEEKKHWCDALVITCSDFRFTSATQEFINERLGLIDNYDYISIPGSIRNLLDKKTRNLVLNNFGVSVRLHNVKRIIIIGHQDCGAGYGESENFTDLSTEYKTISKDLQKARWLMRIRFPHLKVYLYYATVFLDKKQRVYNYRQIP